MNYTTELQQPYLPIHWDGLSKEEITKKADAAIESILETGAPLRMAEALSAMDLFIDTVKKDERFKQYVRDELALEGKYTSPSGAKIEAVEAGVTYDYSSCNCPELKRLEKDFEEAKVNYEAQKAFLKHLNAKGLEMVDKETGEAYSVFPPVKKSTSTFKVSLKAK